MIQREIREWLGDCKVFKYVAAWKIFLLSLLYVSCTENIQSAQTQTQNIRTQMETMETMKMMKIATHNTNKQTRNSSATHSGNSPPSTVEIPMSEIWCGKWQRFGMCACVCIFEIVCYYWIFHDKISHSNSRYGYFVKFKSHTMMTTRSAGILNIPATTTTNTKRKRTM